MAYSVSQGVILTLGGSAVANVTQATVSEQAPTIETSDLSIAENNYKTYIPGLRDAAEVTLNHIGATIATGDKPGGITLGSISFSSATVMSSEVSFRVGEIQAYTTVIRASN